MIFYKKVFISKLLMLSFLFLSNLNSCQRELDQENLSVENLYNRSLQENNIEKLSPDFKWGFAICEYQNSGQENCPNTNWADWENSNFAGGSPAIKDGQKSGKSCDFYNNYEKDIELMKEFGVNSLRFSIAWDKIEPNKDQFSQEAFEHYDRLIDKLLENNITPLITLHHFVHPTWFEELGGFENEENLKYIVRFAKKVFNRYSDRVNLWCTINEPNVFMLQGYIRGVFPPGKTNIYTAIKVLRNLLKAHSLIYTKLKNLKNGSNSKIGFVHQYLKFQPYGRLTFIENLPAIFFNYLMNYLTLNFLETGEFRFPTLNYKSEVEKPLDFIGLNYYSRVLLEFSLKEFIKSSAYPDEITTDMPYAIYPKGLYDALKDVSSLQVPIYITENGIADRTDEKRDLFIRTYLNAMLKAIKDNIDVRGFYYWTFTDNFEWDEGFNMKFGLFEVDFETQERRLRDGAQYFKEIIEKSKNSKEKDIS